MTQQKKIQITWVLWGINYIASLFIFPMLIEHNINIPHSSPGDDPPWYFIREHFLDGLGAWIGLFLDVPLVIWTWKFSKPHAFVMSWQAILWLGMKALPALGIALRTSHPFDVSATGPWPTFDSYMYDPTQKILMLIGGVCAVLLAYLQKRYNIIYTDKK